MAQVKMTQIRFLVGKLCELVEAINRNKNICFFFGFVEQAYIEMFSLNSEITRNASSSSYDI